MMTVLHILKRARHKTTVNRLVTKQPIGEQQKDINGHVLGNVVRSKTSIALKSCEILCFVTVWIADACIEDPGSDLLCLLAC